jgi:hypothetical protein
MALTIPGGSAVGLESEDMEVNVDGRTHTSSPGTSRPRVLSPKNSKVFYASDLFHPTTFLLFC